MFESSDDKDIEDDGTGADNTNSNGNGDIGDAINTGARGGSAEWIRFLSLGVRTEVLGDMTRAKASSSIPLKEKTKQVKSNSKIARKGKADQKLV